MKKGLDMWSSKALVLLAGLGKIKTDQKENSNDFKDCFLFIRMEAADT